MYVNQQAQRAKFINYKFINQIILKHISTIETFLSFCWLKDLAAACCTQTGKKLNLSFWQARPDRLRQIKGPFPYLGNCMVN